MDKRYQVFVSSTFADLQEERKRVIQTLIQMDCIPAGMELFPAIDEEQLKFIKRIIDDCDYYLVIVGGRYGSVTPDGISYYALEKGLKVIAFLHENPDEIAFSKSEKESDLRERLRAFREKLSASRLVKFWNKPEELPGLVALNLPQTIKTYPATGWIRADQIPTIEILAELNETRKRNLELETAGMFIVKLTLPNLCNDLFLIETSVFLHCRQRMQFDRGQSIRRIDQDSALRMVTISTRTTTCSSSEASKNSRGMSE